MQHTELSGHPVRVRYTPRVCAAFRRERGPLKSNTHTAVTVPTRASLPRIDIPSISKDHDHIHVIISDHDGRKPHTPVSRRPTGDRAATSAPALAGSPQVNGRRSRKCQPGETVLIPRALGAG